MISFAAGLCIFLLLVGFMAGRLKAAGYQPAISAGLIFILISHLATALTAVIFPALGLALTMTFVAASAMALRRAQTARSVVTLGISLAAAQAINPMGAIVTAILAPTLTFVGSPNETRVRNAGFLILLLFIPVAAALMLAYLARDFHFGLLPFMSGPFDHFLPARLFASASPQVDGLINAAILAVIALPVWFLAPWHRETRIVAIVAAALVVAVAAAAFLHRSYSLGAFIPSIAALSFLALTEAGGGTPPEIAIALASLSAIASWLFLAVPF